MTNLLHGLTIKMVQDTLRAIRFSNPIPETALQQLKVVERLLPPKAPSHMKDFLLTEWISQQITTKYDQHRKLYKLQRVDPTSNYLQVLACLSQDFKQRHEHLEAWSILYYRHVRVDVTIPNEDLEGITSQSERNIRRRQQHGYVLLYNHITSLELSHLK